ncbi:MAG: RsmE family RNA methyltransferase [Christensenellales bacterium]
MRRFFAETVFADKLVITGDEASHIKNTLRMREGDEFIAFDGTGVDYHCRITKTDKLVRADIITRRQNECEIDVDVTLYQAYPKSGKMEEIVQKAVELGAAGIVPFISARCVKKPDSTARLMRVALSAVKQCGRSVLPAVDGILNFEQALEKMQRHERLIVCWEGEKNTSLKTALCGRPKDIAVVIGPEGGFEEYEVESMRKRGGVTVTLGPRILRTQTAGMFVLSAIMYDMGQI